MELRVFVVEDLQRMRGLLDEVFTSLGGIRVVGSAATEAEAKFWLQENRGAWDVAVLDLVLDQGAGMNLIRQCKEMPGGGSVVVFSSFATPGVAPALPGARRGRGVRQERSRRLHRLLRCAARPREFRPVRRLRAPVSTFVQQVDASGGQHELVRGRMMQP
ncbi:MAG: response regulator [Ramlibacter sp.]